MIITKLLLNSTVFVKLYQTFMVQVHGTYTSSQQKQHFLLLNQIVTKGNMKFFMNYESMGLFG